MTAFKDIVITAMMMVIGDLPWLTLIGETYTNIAQIIQGGRQVRMRPLAGVVVYPAMAYLMLQATSIKQAFLIGLATYAVYDFTVMAVFKDYPLYMAVADSLWGGILFAIIYALRERFF